MINWKTTLAGTLTACGLGLMGANQLDWMPADHKSLLMTIGFALSVIGPALAGLCARDYDKSSEDTGLTPTGSSVPAKSSGTLPALALCGLLAAGLVMGGSGCASDRAAKLLVSTVQTVDGSMVGWTTYQALGQATPDQVAKVRAAYIKYQLAEDAAEKALIASMKTKDQTAWLQASAALTAAQVDLVALVASFTARPLPPLPPTP